MSAIYLGLVALVIGSTFVFNRDIFTPWRVFAGIYGLLLALNGLKLSRVQSDWSFTTHAIFWGAVAVFFLACAQMKFLFEAFNPRWKFEYAGIRTSLQSDSLNMNWRRFLAVWWVCSGAFVLSFMLSVAITGGIPVFSSNPDAARVEFVTASIPTNYGMFCGPIALILGVEFLIFHRRDQPHWKTVAGTVAVVLVLYMAVVTRFELFRFLVFAIILHHYVRKPLKPWHLFAGFGGLVLLFMLVFLIRVGQNSFETYSEITKIKMPAQWSWASTIYAYLATDFWNFDYAIKRYVDGVWEYPTQWGFGLGRGLFYLLQFEGPIESAFGFDNIMNDSIIKLKGYNTVVFMWHFYKDFGVAGVYILTWLGGSLMTLFYLNTMGRPTVFRVVLFGIFTGALALSYHAPLWELWFFYLNIGMIALAHDKIRLA